MFLLKQIASFRNVKVIFFSENAAEAIANATIEMESETVRKTHTIEKPDVKTFDILEKAVSTIPIDDSNIGNSFFPQHKRTTISKYFNQPKWNPANNGNISCPKCDLRFNSVLVKNVHYEIVHNEKKSPKCPVSRLYNFHQNSKFTLS